MTGPALALLLALAGEAPVPVPSADPPGAVAALADGVVRALGPPPEGHPGLALALAGPSDGLAPSLQAALAGALGRAGWSVSPLAASPDAEAAARAAGADWLLRLTAGGSPDGEELAAVGEAVPLWSSFFLQARPGARAAPPRPVSARAAVDATAALLLRPPPRPDLARAALRRLGRLPYPVLALAAGDAGEPGPSILVVEPGGVRLLDAAGREVAARPLDPAGLAPSRYPVATAVLAPFVGGRIGVAFSGGTGGLVLVRRGARLEPAGQLHLAPLAAGEAGLLSGAFAEGKGALQDLLALSADPGARPRSARDLAAVTAAPRGRAPASASFGALGADGVLELLGPGLRTLGRVAGVGAGFALANLDGDGAAELVASQPSAGEPDRIRVVRLPAPGRPGDEQPAFRSGPLEGQLVAGAAADLTGDGRDDVVLAGLVPAAGGGQATELWLLTLDPREAR